MKIKLLVGRVSPDGSNAPGDEIDVDDMEAYNLISSNQAEPKVKKEFTELEKRIDKIREQERKKESKRIAVEKEEELKDGANALLEELVKVVETITSINPGYKDEFLGKFHESFTTKETER
jgi:hypothetical protein